MRSIRKAVSHAVLVFFVGLSASWAADGVTVMTRNMDAGTDFGFFLANFQTNPALGVQLTLQEVLKNDFPGRAARLADEIAAAKPDLVGLQEVTIWTIPTPGGLVVVDQLELLLAALAAKNAPYSVVAVNTLTDLTFPIDGGVAARFTDRDAVIVRTGSPFAVGNVQTHLYSTLLPLTPSITVLRGWISADVTLRQDKFRFVTTHLESSGGMYGNSQVDLIQAAQAQELAQAFAASPFPVVIAGDFNSNATRTPPEQTPSFKVMLATGYTDSWSAVYRGIPGFTWPLYVEDPLREHTRGPFERIDFVFTLGLTPTAVELTGLQAPHGSDHAGVVTALAF